MFFSFPRISFSESLLSAPGIYLTYEKSFPIFRFHLKRCLKRDVLSMQLMSIGIILEFVRYNQCCYMKSPCITSIIRPILGSTVNEKAKKKKKKDAAPIGIVQRVADVGEFSRQ